jgi:hypothetical protein
MAQLQHCSDCHALGHTPDSCPIYSGTAIRLLFKNPLSPVRLQELFPILQARSAMPRPDKLRVGTASLLWVVLLLPHRLEPVLSHCPASVVCPVPLAVQARLPLTQINGQGRI